MTDTAPAPGRLTLAGHLRRSLRKVWIFWRRFVRGRYDIGMLLKPFVPRSLFGRSIIIIIAPMVLTQAIVTQVFFDRHWDNVMRRLSRTAAGDIAMVIASYEALDSPGGFAELAARAERTMGVSMRFQPGAALPPNQPRAFLPALDRTLRMELENKLTYPFWFDTTRYPRHVDIRVALNGGVMRIIIPQKSVFTHSGFIFVVWMAGASIVLLAVAILFLLGQVRPIQRLAAAADSFGKGRDMPDFKPAGAREVRRAAMAFIEMKDRIARHISQRTEMLAGVSHDLRTPLTRLKLELAMLGEGPEIAAMRSDIEEMEHMLDAYLAFAQGQEGEAAKEVSIRQFLEDIVENARRRGQTVALTLKRDLTVPLRPNAMTRAVSNLVENAGKHARHTEVSIHRDKDTVSILIDDDGPGIPEAKWDEAFRPFHRLDEGRNLETGGVGLGLAVARDIVRGHGGDLTLDHSPLGGLRAEVRIPI